MTINQLLAELQAVDPANIVLFDFCGCTPTYVDVWNGNSNLPALGWKQTGTLLTGDVMRVSTLIKVLKRVLSGKVFEGPNGEEIAFTGNELLRIDNYGERSGTILKQVNVRYDGTVVILGTAFSAVNPPPL